MPIKKYIKKKIVKKLSGGGGVKGRLEKEFTEDTKLSGGGYVMEDVLKKENYPKKHEGGYIKKDREELKSEIKGMGPEGKAYLRDKLKDKDYEGILKKKYKWDLDKELYGMHKKGKEYLKDLVKEKDHKKKHDLKKKFAAHPSPHVKKIKHSLGQIIESKALKKKLREKEGISKKDIVGKANGGQIKLGKGVKAKKKFLDSIGHKPMKHFEDKAERHYKEGATGYKNLKKRQKSTVPGFVAPMIVAAGISAAATAAKMKADADRAEKQKKQQQAEQISQGEQEAGKTLATTGKGMMKADTTLHEGGAVKKDPKEKESWWDKFTGGHEAEAKRLGFKDKQSYLTAKKKIGKGTGFFGPTKEDFEKAKAPAPVKKPAPVSVKKPAPPSISTKKPAPAPVKKGDRVSQIRQKLKSLIKSNRKYSKEEGIAKAKLYKELASLGKPSKFGDYWTKTYLDKKPKAVKPKAVEKTPEKKVKAPYRMSPKQEAQDPYKFRPISPSKLFPEPKPVDRVKQKKAAAKFKKEKDQKENFRRIKKHLRSRAKEQIEKKQIPQKKDDKFGPVMTFKEGGQWIQGAVKKPGALRAVAKKDKLIKGDEKLSASNLNKLGAKAKKSGNSLLAKRVSLAKTFAKMRKK